MKNLTPEIISKAKAADSVDALLVIAKENDIELTEDAAKTCFEQLHAIGTVADEELDAVAGGGSCPGDDEEESSSSGVNKVTCPHCQGLVSRAFTKCPWCSKTIAFY